MLAPEVETLPSISKLMNYTELETEINWSLESISYIALHGLPSKFSEMKKLCSNEKILNMFY